MANFFSVLLAQHQDPGRKFSLGSQGTEAGPHYLKNTLEAEA